MTADIEEIRKECGLDAWVTYHILTTSRTPRRESLSVGARSASSWDPALTRLARQYPRPHRYRGFNNLERSSCPATASHSISRRTHDTAYFEVFDFGQQRFVIGRTINRDANMGEFFMMARAKNLGRKSAASECAADALEIIRSSPTDEPYFWYEDEARELELLDKVSQALLTGLLEARCIQIFHDVLQDHEDFRIGCGVPRLQRSVEDGRGADRGYASQAATEMEELIHGRLRATITLMTSR